MNMESVSVVVGRRQSDGVLATMGKVRKIGPKGDGIGIALPDELMESVGVSPGDRLDISTDGERLILRPVQLRPRETGEGDA
jgi:antitoxin component of MazEF toxin-antitoxin module